MSSRADKVKAFAQGALMRFWDDENQTFEEFVIELVNRVSSKDFEFYSETSKKKNGKRKKQRRLAK
jgi:hypothetical protein